jgi:glycine cleavage system H protein
VNPEQLLYAATHEWVHVETDAQGSKLATVGISRHAVEALTDLVYLELPELGRQVRCGEPLGEVESVKAVSDLYSPVDGEIVSVHRDLPEHLERLTEDPYGEGWIVKIRLTDEASLRELLDYAAYQRLCAEESA